MSKQAWDIIAQLEEQYAGDDEVLEIIENAKKDIEYIEKQEAAGNYTGQPAEGKAEELRGFLEEWY